MKIARVSGNRFVCKCLCREGLLRKVGNGDRWLIVNALSRGELGNSPEKSMSMKGHLAACDSIVSRSAKSVSWYE